MTTWTIHQLTSEPDLPPMYAIASGDGYGFLLGEAAEVAALTERLAAFIATNDHDGEIPDTAEILGYKHHTAYEAAKEFDVPVSTVTKACRRGWINDARKVGRSWRFSQAAFLAWMVRRQEGPGRPPGDAST